VAPCLACANNDQPDTEVPEADRDAPALKLRAALHTTEAT
jgi:hypothetical protein